MERTRNEWIKNVLRKEKITFRKEERNCEKVMKYENREKIKDKMGWKVSSKIWNKRKEEKKSVTK